MPNADKAFAFVSSDYSNLTLPNGQTEMSTVMSAKDSETRIAASGLMEMVPIVLEVLIWLAV